MFTFLVCNEHATENNQKIPSLLALNVFKTVICPYNSLKLIISNHFMPELPEVETTRRGIAPHIEQQRVQRVHIHNGKLRWPVPSELPTLLEGQVLNRIERRAKYLLFHFDNGTVIGHLGMSGSMRIVCQEAISDEPLRTHDHIEWVFENGTRLRYHDPRRFGCMLWTATNPEEHKLIQPLGPEPLSDAFTAEHLHTLSRTRKVAIKPFIMNAHIVVGVGNIYASEALFEAGIRPTKAANRVTLKQYERLVAAIKIILARSIEQGGTTLRDFVNGNGEPGYFAQQLNVYGRKGESCTTCQDNIKQIVQAQRASYYCPSCQT